MHKPDSLLSDQATLTEARDKIEALRVWVFTELEKSPLGSRADDALESLHLELENRRGSLNAVLDEIQDELNAMPPENLEHIQHYRNGSIGRSAA